ncbi:hypothetical protein [Actinomadura sp. HBU206391]|nr:hypothetical protein [Actinomadura sp. HBU206391]MBC6458129.1 hypothetical protein [Actinomadura sp. HBU206391]
MESDPVTQDGDERVVLAELQPDVVDQRGHARTFIEFVGQRLGEQLGQ